MEDFAPWIYWLFFVSRFSPLIVFIGIVTWYIRAKDKSRILLLISGWLFENSVAEALKIITKTPRPSPENGGYAMPSAHSATMGYISAAILYGTIIPEYRRKKRVKYSNAIIFVMSILGTIPTVMHRVALLCHTWPQVAAGLGLGWSFSYLWFKYVIPCLAKLQHA